MNLDLNVRFILKTIFVLKLLLFHTFIHCVFLLLSSKDTKHLIVKNVKLLIFIVLVSLFSSYFLSFVSERQRGWIKGTCYESNTPVVSHEAKCLPSMAFSLALEFDARYGFEIGDRTFREKCEIFAENLGNDANKLVPQW